MTIREKLRCPNASRKYLHETDTCDLVNKMCLLESNTPCEIYEEFLAEAEPDTTHDNRQMLLDQAGMTEDELAWLG